MPIFSKPHSDLELKISDLSVGRAQALESIFAEDWLRNPVPSVFRTLELRRLQGEDILRPLEDFALQHLPTQFSLTGQLLSTAANIFDRTQPERKTLSADAANQVGNKFGLQFEEPITEDALEVLVERKRRERIFQSTRERAPRGLFFSPLKLATSFASQAFDPLNIALAFVPITASIRFLQVAKSSRRFLKGAIEGLFGAGLVEPLVLNAATQEQADYGMFDSLINVAFGAGLGSGLHVGAGKVGDFYKKRARLRAAGEGAADILSGRDGPETPPLPLRERIANAADDATDTTVSDRVTAAQPETRADAARLASAQLIEGRPVDVQGLLDLDSGARAPHAPRETLDATRNPPTEEVRAEIEHQVSKALDENDAMTVSKELADEAETAVKEASDVSDPVEIERLANEAQDRVDAIVEDLGPDELALVRALDESIDVLKKEGGVVALKTGEEAAALVATAQRKKSFLAKLGECVLRNS